MKFALCNELCQGLEFSEACALAAVAGYQGIEIAPFTLADSVEQVGPSERARLRQTARNHSLEVVGLHWLLVKPTGLYLNHPDSTIRDRTAAYLRAEIDLCADLGGRIMVVGSPKQRNVLESDTYEAAWERTVQVFKSLAPCAESRGVCLCIEPLSRAETNFLNRAEEARRLLEAVNHPAFQMILDVKAMSDEAEPIPEIIRKSARCLRHFHANDANRQGPGFGSTDFRPIAAALREVSFNGYISVEVIEFSAGAERIARESRRYLRGVFGE